MVAATRNLSRAKVKELNKGLVRKVDPKFTTTDSDGEVRELSWDELTRSQKIEKARMKTIEAGFYKTQPLFCLLVVFAMSIAALFLYANDRRSGAIALEVCAICVLFAYAELAHFRGYGRWHNPIEG